MIRNISQTFLVVFVALFCGIGGYVVGGMAGEEQERLIEEYGQKQAEALNMALDANMFSSEPYNSYALSLLLYEATLEERDPLPAIQKILLIELKDRSGGVEKYCESRAHSGFRKACLNTLERASSYVQTKSS